MPSLDHGFSAAGEYPERLSNICITYFLQRRRVRSIALVLNGACVLYGINYRVCLPGLPGMFASAWIMLITAKHLLISTTRSDARSVPQNHHPNIRTVRGP